jgi:hypothetical protein
MNISAGTTNFNSSATPNLSIALNSANLNFNVSQTLGTLTLNSNGSATLASGTRMLNTANLVPGGGKLNLTDGAAIARAGSIGTLSGTTYSDIQGLIQAGRNGGNWNGNGIYTSLTDAKGALPRTTLATALASQALGIDASDTTSWRGQSVTGDAVLIAYTYAGDANLSGFIDADDYFQIDVGYNQATAGHSYFGGDFNYDGIINGDDFAIIDQNFVGQGAPMTGAAPLDLASVPEPAAGALIALAAAWAISRRRRIDLS